MKRLSSAILVGDRDMLAGLLALGLVDTLEEKSCLFEKAGESVRYGDSTALAGAAGSIDGNRIPAPSIEAPYVWRSKFKNWSQTWSSQVGYSSPRLIANVEGSVVKFVFSQESPNDVDCCCPRGDILDVSVSRPTGLKVKSDDCMF